jgi:hypothetical protein
MRTTLVIAAATILLGSALATAACSSETTIGIEDDGGTSSSGGSSGGSSSGSSGDPDGGTSSGGLTPTQIKPGNMRSVGVVLNDVVYVIDNGGARALEAIPIAGGTSTKIADLGAQDGFLIRGGAVAVYTAVANGQGTISLWSRAAGFKANVATNSALGLFAASPDGTRVAFSVLTTPVGATPTSTSMAVSDLGAGAVSTTPVITGAVAVGNPAAAINLAAAQPQGQTPAACPLDIAFVGTRLYAAYCTGTAVGTTVARLVTVPAGTPTPDRLDAANNAAGTLRPSWQPDTAGNKVFAMTSAGAGRIITFDGTISNLVANTEEGFMTPDGTAAIYRTTAGAIAKGTGAAAPTTLVATGALGIVGGSPDGKWVLYYTQEDQQSGLIDLRGVDHTVAPAPVTYVTGATAGPIGVNATSADVVYLDELAQGGFKLKSKPVAGGAEKLVASGVAGAELARTGTAGIAYTNPDLTALQNGVLIGDVNAIDTAMAGTPQKFADQVPDPLLRIKDKTVIYGTLPMASMPGIYTLTLP